MEIKYGTAEANPKDPASPQISGERPKMSKESQKSEDDQDDRSSAEEDEALGEVDGNDFNHILDAMSAEKKGFSYFNTPLITRDEEAGSDDDESSDRSKRGRDDEFNKDEEGEAVGEEDEEKLDNVVNATSVGKRGFEYLDDTKAEDRDEEDGTRGKNVRINHFEATEEEENLGQREDGNVWKKDAGTDKSTETCIETASTLMRSKVGTKSFNSSNVNQATSMKFHFENNESRPEESDSNGEEEIQTKHNSCLEKNEQMRRFTEIAQEDEIFSLDLSGLEIVSGNLTDSFENTQNQSSVLIKDKIKLENKDNSTSMLFEDKISKAEEFSTVHPDRRLEIEGNSVTKIAEERITEIVSVERNSRRAIMKTNQSKSRGKNHDLSPTPPEVMECNEFNIAANESVGGGNESGRDCPQSATPPPQLKEEEYERLGNCERVILEEIKEAEGEPDSKLFTEWTKDNKKKFTRDRLMDYDLSPTPPEVMECNEFNVAANESVGGGNESGRDGPQSGTPPPQLKEEEFERLDNCERVILEGIKETEGEPDSELFTEWTKDNKKKFTRDQLMDYDLNGILCIDETLLSNKFDESIQIGNSFPEAPNPTPNNVEKSPQPEASLDAPEEANGHELIRPNKVSIDETLLSNEFDESIQIGNSFPEAPNPTPNNVEKSPQPEASLDAPEEVNGHELIRPNKVSILENPILKNRSDYTYDPNEMNNGYDDEEESDLPNLLKEIPKAKENDLKSPTRNYKEKAAIASENYDYYPFHRQKIGTIDKLQSALPSIPSSGEEEEENNEDREQEAPGESMMDVEESDIEKFKNWVNKEEKKLVRKLYIKNKSEENLLIDEILLSDEFELFIENWKAIAKKIRLLPKIVSGDRRRENTNLRLVLRDFLNGWIQGGKFTKMSRRAEQLKIEDSKLTEILKAKTETDIYFEDIQGELENADNPIRRLPERVEDKLVDPSNFENEFEKVIQSVEELFIELLNVEYKFGKWFERKLGDQNLTFPKEIKEMLEDKNDYAYDYDWVNCFERLTPEEEVGNRQDPKQPDMEDPTRPDEDFGTDMQNLFDENSRKRESSNQSPLVQNLNVRASAVKKLCRSSIPSTQDWNRRQIEFITAAING